MVGSTQIHYSSSCTRRENKIGLFLHALCSAHVRLVYSYFIFVDYTSYV